MVTWDTQNPDWTVVIYEETQPGIYKKLGETKDPTFELPTLSPGEHIIVAQNVFEGEVSPYSNKVRLTVPHAPKGLRVRVIVEVDVPLGDGGATRSNPQ